MTNRPADVVRLISDVSESLSPILQINVSATSTDAVARIDVPSSGFECTIDDEVGVYSLGIPRVDLLFDLDQTGDAARRILVSLGKEPLELVEALVGDNVIDRWVETEPAASSSIRPC